eukprot:CAMPEP_0118923836 /NCGR_PEP_ID=MMETSP1169-20130426/2225_1 /TAXON_ID=36882 /ORGANISM="Pyramimonas obovata, Strain CCMP722" /LENGTH=168 /DNA_ID=CAMNT_0006864889 /DNA_START=181 /DNA_END=688 /DNA_ORIENTATION=+
MLKTFEERLNEGQVARERIETSLAEEKEARERLETRLAEEQKAREDLEARLLQEQSAREALEGRLLDAMKGKANGTDLLALNALLPGKVSTEDLQALKAQLEKYKDDLEALRQEGKTKATLDNLQSMQRDLVVQFWALKGTGANGPMWTPKTTDFDEPIRSYDEMTTR